MVPVAQGVSPSLGQRSRLSPTTWSAACFGPGVGVTSFSCLIGFGTRFGVTARGKRTFSAKRASTIGSGAQRAPASADTLTLNAI